MGLAESIRYGSAGTIEYIVDDKSGDFFFLEMNTRLQVEHGITELCYDVDLVKLMLLQADAELAGKGGIKAETLKEMQPSEPKGAAIECRVYAENPARDYAPSPGILQIVEWNGTENSRIDTWVKTGTIVSSHYDPLLAKVMFHSESRNTTIKEMHQLLTKSRICGPPTNLDFLAAILADSEFVVGNTMTKFLATFEYAPAAIDVLTGGAYTQVQDYPGRPTMGRGFPVCAHLLHAILFRTKLLILCLACWAYGSSGFSDRQSTCGKQAGSRRPRTNFEWTGTGF